MFLATTHIKLFVSSKVKHLSCLSNQHSNLVDYITSFWFVHNTDTLISEVT